MYVNIHTHRLGDGINVFNIELDGVEREILDKRGNDLAGDVYFSVGLHPMTIERVNVERALEDFVRIMGRERVIAVGECGLDRRVGVSMERQELLLEYQVRCAESMDKPVIIHCVKAYSELIAFAKRIKSSVPWVVHGFNNNVKILEQLLVHGFYISIGAALLNEKSNAYRLLREIPLASLFFESDVSDVQIQAVYKAASRVLKIDEEELRGILLGNYNRVFLRL